MTDSATSTDEILFEREGALGIVRLNRPKALNALTHGMCLALDRALQEWERDDSVHAVVVRGNGDRAFCAGGDVRHIAKIGREKPDEARAFFRDEYRLNARIHRFPKPYISFLDGVTMGGGFGISVHGSHRIATPKTLFAMPETGIGMFPDVGGSYFLSRCPGKIGLYLGLSGARLGAGDAIYAGVAQYHVPSEKLDALQHSLSNAQYGTDRGKTVDSMIRAVATPVPEPTLAAHRAIIDRIFALPTDGAIVEALRHDGSDFAKETVDKIHHGSPTSVALTHHQIVEGATLKFDDCMRMEWRMVNRILEGHDFYEGVTALLIDKGRKPEWKPASLAEVTRADVEAYFAPLPGGDLAFDWD
ncbi:MAG TPA: enoyl-CoA hydratase/isomerase family protein [Magnetospirillaceae bacterium]|jgi:enoyl-CoA hydratase